MPACKVSTYLTRILYLLQSETKNEYNPCGEKLIEFASFCFACQNTSAHSCVGTCASVSGHLLFTRTNTDGEVSPGVSGDEMQPCVKHGGRSFSLQLQVHFLLHRVYILCVRRYFQDDTNCNLLCWRILNISSLLNGI